MYPRKKSWLHITIQNFTMHHFTWFLSYDMKKVGLCVLATYAMPWFFKASKLKARLLVITLVSDLWSDLVFFCLSPFFLCLPSCYIYKKDKNGCFILDFFSIRSVQNGSNLIKLDQIGFLTNQKMLL